MSTVKDALSMISFDAYFSPGESQKEAHSQIHKPLFGLSGGLWTSGRASWFSQEFTNPRIRSPGKEHISSGRRHEHPAATDAQGLEAQVHRTGQQGTRPGDPGIAQGSLSVSRDSGQGPGQVRQGGKTRLKLREDKRGT